MLQAQKRLALAKTDGGNQIADAQRGVEEAMRSHHLLRRDTLSEREYNTRREVLTKRIDQANARLAIVTESVAQQIAQAEREVADATESLERSRREAAESARKRKDDEERAVRERLESEKRKQDERAKAQTELADVTKKLNRATAQRERAERTRERVDSGTAKDQQVHGGISGGGYSYNRDRDGNITRFDQFRRSRRYADRAARDQASNDRDGNASRNARRARDIEEQMRKGRNVSKRDRDFLRDWQDFRNQKAPNEDVIKKLDEIKTALQQTLEVN